MGRPSLPAFSLVELCVVIAIIGILAAIALPSITQTMAVRTGAMEVDKVQAAIEGARDTARMRLRCIRVQKVSSSALQLTEMDQSLTGCGVVPTVVTTKQFNATYVEITTAIDVTFTRSGSVDGVGADPTFIIKALRPNELARPYQFKIFRLLGLVRRA